MIDPHRGFSACKGRGVAVGPVHARDSVGRGPAPQRCREETLGNERATTKATPGGRLQPPWPPCIEGPPHNSLARSSRGRAVREREARVRADGGARGARGTRGTRRGRSNVHSEHLEIDADGLLASKCKQGERSAASSRRRAWFDSAASIPEDCSSLVLNFVSAICVGARTWFCGRWLPRDSGN